MSNTAEELATTVSGLLGVEECVHHEAPPMEEDIDEDIRCMVASMCGGGGDGVISSSMKEATRPREVGKQVGITNWASFPDNHIFCCRSWKEVERGSKADPPGEISNSISLSVLWPPLGIANHSPFILSVFSNYGKIL